MPKASRKRKRSVSPVSNKRILKVLESLERRVGKIEQRSKITSRSSSSTYSCSDSERDVSAQHSSSEESSKAGREAQVEEFTKEPLVNDAAARPSLNSDILSLLGVDVVNDMPYGPAIHENVVDRWLHIIKAGLEDQGRDALLRKYPAPENAKHFGTPQLNPLVKHAIVDSVAKRDERLARQQSQISASLSAIGKTITILLGKEEGEKSQGDSKDIIEHLSDTGRLLADVHHIFSVSRRDLVSLNLNKDLKDPLLESPIDEWLFGIDLSERLKTAKDLQVSSKQLLASKHSIKKTSFPRKTLNWRSPPKSQKGVRRSGHYQQTPKYPKSQLKQQFTYQVRHPKYQDEKKYRRH